MLQDMRGCVTLILCGLTQDAAPRTLVRGGKLHTKYKITLPESFFVGGEG
jgi:hypothetical protein